MEPLFTTGDFLRAVPGAFSLPENQLMEREKPRASSILGDAREQAYMMSATPYDLSEGTRLADDHPLTAEQGRHMEDLSVQILNSMGFTVVDRQLALPDDYFVTGHPDGRLARMVQPGANAEFVVDDLDLTVGFEHKHPGRWGYIEILKYGLFKAHPDWVVQAMLYGYALGWDAVQFVVIAQDASGIRTEANRNARAKNPKTRWAGIKREWDPKLHVETVDLRPLYETLLPVVRQRAEWLTSWYHHSRIPLDVAFEHDPREINKSTGEYAFPWGYSPWHGRALADIEQLGYTGARAPGLPFTGQFVAS